MKRKQCDHAAPPPAYVSPTGGGTARSGYDSRKKLATGLDKNLKLNTSGKGVVTGNLRKPRTPN